MSGTDADAPKKNWRETLSVYVQLNIILILLLGIASGFPLLLTSSTLLARLKESGIDIKTIGLFALVGLPYTFKFLFAFFVDAIHFPWAKSQLAHRKTWCILSQLLLAGSLLGMSAINPEQDILLMGVFALLTASFSAMQDIVIDAMRVEMVRKDTQGAAAAASVAGYRVGMLMAGAGALVLANYIPWDTVYLIGAGIMCAFILITLSVRKLQGFEEATAGETAEDEAQIDQAPDKNADEPKPAEESFIRRAIVKPLSDFFTRPSAIIILLFIALFKLGDAMAGSLSVPFYLDIGFTKIEIAAITKVIGVIAVLGGTFLGGFVVKRLPIYKALWICGILQLLSNFVFVWLAQIGASVPALTVCICVENVTGGMGTAAFVAYISQLCNVRFTATQYALLSSLSSVGRTLFSSSAGVIVDQIGWSGFYVSTAVLAIPGLTMLFWLQKRSKAECTMFNAQ